MKSKLFFLSIFCVLFSGCVHWEEIQSRGEKISQQWINENKQINEKLGERMFAKNYDEVFDAVVLGLARANCISRNASRESGFIFAESATTLLSGDSRLNNHIVAIDKSYATATSKLAPEIHFWGMGKLQTLNSGRDIAVYFTQMKTGVKVRIRITPQPIRYRTSLPMFTRDAWGDVGILLTDTTPVIYPELLKDEMRFLWEMIERQGFLEKTMSGQKK